MTSASRARLRSSTRRCGPATVALDEDDDEAALAAAARVVAMTEVLGVNPLARALGCKAADASVARPPRRRSTRSCGPGSRRDSRRDRSATSSGPTRSATRWRLSASRSPTPSPGPSGRCVRTNGSGSKTSRHGRGRPDMPGNSQRRGAVRKGGKKHHRRLRRPASTRARGQGPDPQGRPTASTTRPTSAPRRRPNERVPAAPRRGRNGPLAAARQGLERDGLRPQLGRRGAASRRPRLDDVRRDPHRLRRPRPGGAQARDASAASPSSRRLAASSTGSPTVASTRAWRCRCRPTSTPTRSDLIDPEMPGIPLVVALDGITDPRNLGAIVRSVAAFGGHGVVVPERRSVGMTASAWKTSAGAAARIPVAKASNLTRTLEEFKKAGFFVLGLDMDGDVELPDLSRSRPSRSSSSPAPRARASRGSCARRATRSSPSR